MDYQYILERLQERKVHFQSIDFPEIAADYQYFLDIISYLENQVKEKEKKNDQSENTES